MAKKIRVDITCWDDSLAIIGIPRAPKVALRGESIVDSSSWDEVIAKDFIPNIFNTMMKDIRKKTVNL